jgi:beta-galactosidase
MVKSRGIAILQAAASAACMAASTVALANDTMFPAQTGASSSIGWTNNYFSVKGKPIVVSAGEIHYARVPRELWHERLVKMKRAGFNTVSTYVFWNAQQPAPGVFELGDNLDLDAWLSAIEDAGMYAIVRPGPYNCAEWLAGGIPQWITAKGMQIRNSSADYLAAADAYYEKIIPIIAKHQIHKGGGVIWMQIENEHPAGSGTDGNDYLKHLYDKARSLGMEVPLYYSALHHASDPAGSTPFGNRTNPWFSSEFWSGWYSLPFGEMNASDLATLTRGAWKVIAFGGGGNTFYVFHGGTNFGYSGDTSTTSYDYRAPLGEASQLRQGYFAVRGPAAFSRAFETLMGTSQDGGSATLSGGLKSYVRRSPSDGVAVFLDNQGTGAVQTQVKLSNPAVQFPAGSTQISVAANEIRAVVARARWTANATFAYLATNVLGKLTLGSKIYYACHGRSGEAGEIAVQYNTAPATPPATPWNWDAANKLARATFNYPTGDTVTELSLDSGDGASATFLVVNTPLANRTWFTDKAIYVGATYVDDDSSIEVPLAGGKVMVYSADGRSELSVPAVAAPSIPPIGNWQWRDAAAEAAPGYDDSGWASSPQPQPFGANNFQNGYGWYRAKLTVTAAGSVTATIGGGVRASAMAFANGTQVKMSNNSFTFNAVAGENTVAILAKHEGLDKMYNVTGSTGTGQYAGVWGNVTNGSSALASSWRFRGGLGGMDETAVVGLVKNWTTFVGGTWSDTQSSKSSPAFWRGTFKSPLQSGVFATVGLRTSGLSSGSAWVNGHNLGRFSGSTLLYLPECWLAADNTVVIYDAGGSAPTSAKLEYIETRARYAGGGTGTDGGAGGAGSGGTAGGSAGGASGRTTGMGGSIAAGAGGRASGGASGQGGRGGGGGSGGGGSGTAGATSSVGGSGSESGGAVGGTGTGGASLSTGASAGTAGTGTRAGGEGGSFHSNGGASGSGGESGSNGEVSSGSGCSCAIERPAPSGGVWLILGFLLLWRRRGRSPVRRVDRADL